MRDFDGLAQRLPLPSPSWGGAGVGGERNLWSGRLRQRSLEQPRAPHPVTLRVSILPTRGRVWSAAYSAALARPSFSRMRWPTAVLEAGTV